jgi:hypothetical protein
VQLRQRAQTQYERGDRARAVDLANTRPQDPELRALLRQALKDSTSEATAARAAAQSLPPGPPTSTFQAADRQQKTAERLARGGRLADAIHAYWGATSQFQQAAAEASKAAAARPTTTSPAPPTSPPPDTRLPVGQPVVVPPTVDKPSAPPTPPPSAQPTSQSGPTTTGRANPAPAPSGPTLAEEQAAITAVVNAYGRAYSELKVGDVVKVFPNANGGNALGRAFSELESQQVDLKIGSITVTGTTAQVVCTWSTKSKPKNARAISTSQSATLQLQKTAAGWIIVNRR